MLDRLIISLDRAVRTLSGVSVSVRPIPGDDDHVALPSRARRHVAALMRVNHSGEVCAQALYHGQALVARQEWVVKTLQLSAEEEADHLAWTERRVGELGGRTSVLDPVWLVGSFLIGVGAAAMGDRWSLGFLAETERQVVEHLDRHLALLPENDERTRAILMQMRADEGKHATVAEGLGAAKLPSWVQVAMRLSSRVMTGISYRV